MAERLTYDEKQAAAVLSQCQRCLKFYYMTTVAEVCISCRSAVPHGIGWAAR